MNKKILMFLALLFLPSIVQAQTNLKASELNALTTPDTADLIIISDVSQGESKKITYGNLVSGIGGTGLGANLSSSGFSILSNTGTVGFGDDNLVTTGTMTASHFVATGNTTTTFDNLTVTGSLIVPVEQNCAGLVNGQMCVDTNLAGLPPSLVFVGNDGLRRVVIGVPLVGGVFDYADQETPVYDENTDEWIPSAIPIDYIEGSVGTSINPKTPSTTKLFVGHASEASADHVFDPSGAAILNKQQADVIVRFAGDTDANLIYMEDDKVCIGTNSCQNKLSVQGTLDIMGEGVSQIEWPTVASTDPCSGRANTIFFKTAGVPCYCDASGVDKKIADDSACF